MQAFSFYCPTRILFGRDTERQTGEQVRAFGGTNVLIVYGGQSARRSGLLDRVEQSLTDSGLPFVTLGGVQPNPRLSLVREGIRLAIESGADFILGVGGGSVIDTAKAVAHGAANPELDIWDDIWMKKVPLTKTLPVGAVLTISAAGSELSDSAVLTDEEHHLKRGLGTDLQRPKFAIMNPGADLYAAALPGRLRRGGHPDAHAGTVLYPGGRQRADRRAGRGDHAHRGALCSRRRGRRA